MNDFLALPYDFFDRKHVRYLLATDPNGSKYVLLYIWMMMMTIGDSGRLMLKQGTPMEATDIAMITGYDIDCVNAAIDTFKHLGIISNHSGTYHLKEGDEFGVEVQD